MDNLTHSLFGLTLARTPLSRAGRGTTVALLLSSNVPDADVFVTFGGAVRYLEFHRGPTHGPLGVVGLAAVVAGLVWLGLKRWDRGHAGAPAGFLMLWLISMLGIGGHVLMDLPTSYGTRPLSPFSWTWIGVDWMPIIDIYLIAMLGAALWFARGPKGTADTVRRRRRNATFALALMAANYGLRAASHHTAVAQAAEAFGSRLPEWCADGVRPDWAIDRWPRASHPAHDRYASRCLVEIAAMPDFISPFRWRLIAQLSNSYEMRDIDLLTGAGLPGREALARRILSVRVPNQWTPAVAKAAATPTARVFLGFSRFPAVSSTLADDGSVVVRWSDLRFVQGALDDPRQFRRGLFGATVVIGRNGKVLEHRLGP